MTFFTPTIDAVRASLANGGDLPIFSASVNRISQLSSDPDSDTMQLAMEVMKDASLSVKLLQLVNSPMYYRGSVPIGSVTQAIMLLGFETVKSVCMTLKLLDSFTISGDDPLDLNTKLVHAYVSAGMMHELASEVEIDKVEHSYMCGLLHNIGEILVAHTLPSKYKAVLSATEEGKSWGSAQAEVLRVTFDDVGGAILGDWGFPVSLINSLGRRLSNETTPLKSATDFYLKIPTYVSLIVGSVYQTNHAKRHSTTNLVNDTAELLEISRKQVIACLDSAFKRGCDMAKQFDLDRMMLAPKVVTTNDELRDKLAKDFAYRAHSSLRARGESVDGIDVGGEQRGESAVEEAAKEKVAVGSVDSSKLLDILQQMTMLMSSGAPLNNILVKTLEGVQSAAGCKRVALVMLSAKRDTYQARISMGSDSDALKGLLSAKVDVTHDLFSRAMFEMKDLLVSNPGDNHWKALLPTASKGVLNDKGFSVAHFSVNNRPIGFIYADMGKESIAIGPEQQQAIVQLVTQARLALRMSK